MRLWKKILLAVLAAAVIILAGIGNYFYNYAFIPDDKDFIESGTPESTPASAWYSAAANRSYWQLTSEDGLQLSAIYLPAATEQQKTVIIAHGYMGNAEDMYNYAYMYHELGYHVLVPDARGHGKSAGAYIGFGWDERKDYLQWISKVLAPQPEQQIVLHGVSMGAATVMMTSGEKLPENVKAIVEDCGYSSVAEELSYQLKEMFGLPAFPIIPVTDLVTKVRAGYFFSEASAVKQLQKNVTPMLFIHGSADDFVPFSMLEDVYQATNAPKEKFVVAGAEHGQAFRKDPAGYRQQVSSFLAKYL